MNAFSHRPPWQTAAADTADERPVALTVNGQVWLTFMCTPANLEALSVGFLFNEGVLAGLADVAAVRVCPSGANVDVWLRRAVARPAAWRRTAGCVGGVTAAEGIPSLPAVGAGPLLPAERIGALMRALFAGQQLYREAGGVHCSALSDGETLVALAEDIGRHNTLDKLAGWCLLRGRATRGLILLTTGRLSSDMVQKAARMGTPIVISRSAPSRLACELADAWGLTLVGYARRDRFTVYTHPQRIGSELGQPALALEEMASA